MASPIRLDEKLIQDATAEASVNRRTTPKQIELWAEIGRAVSDRVSPQDLLAITQGLAEIRVDRVQGYTLETKSVLDLVARERGQLTKRLMSHGPNYQVCTDHPGYLEEVLPDGSRRIGQFEQGEFHPLDEPSKAHG